jgi:hypothetical protein
LFSLWGWWPLVWMGTGGWSSASGRAHNKYDRSPPAEDIHSFVLRKYFRLSSWRNFSWLIFHHRNRWIFSPSESSRWGFTRFIFSPSESSRWDFTRFIFSPSESFRWVFYLRNRLGGISRDKIFHPSESFQENFVYLFIILWSLV